MNIEHATSNANIERKQEAATQIASVFQSLLVAQIENGPLENVSEVEAAPSPLSS